MSINATLREIAKARLLVTKIYLQIRLPAIAQVMANLNSATALLNATTLDLELRNMRRQEYELVSACIRRTMASTSNERERAGIRMAAVALADALAQSKPAFDYHLFLNNCGVNTL